ncbi:hypothetical protein HUN59_14265 [Curtobacterium sp. Csp2]|uniref:hypothetical protein n=1 Tax=Curtobacterium sp. Csp2 TaxID=2495430 RepID=UPI0015811723|nr:hypothetical protein [Curtobacterium sp. Csp2]QKS17212.1 hypothetical protein HUN59_14265 [Curtobacterium sp. Csp2]
MTTIVAPGMRTLAVVLWVVSVALVPLALLTADRPWLAPVPSIFIAFVAWAVLWRPRYELTAEHLVVVDVRRRSTYAWPRIVEVRTKYGIEIVTSEGVRRTWLATRPTAPLGVLDADRPTVTERLDVPAAAEVMRAHLPAPVTPVGPPPATVVPQIVAHRTHGWTVTALIVLGIAASMAAAQL